MTTKEEIHLKACDYAQLCQQQITTNRKSQKAKALTHDQLQSAWLNHYDGFSAGYRAALEEMKDERN